MNETDFKTLVRLRAQSQGVILWRNNVGATYNNRGQFIRYGLANDSARVNNAIKSSDLIGIKKIKITPEMVGKIIGVFVAYEIKKPGWIYKATQQERAQKKWIDLINELGGEAKFISNLEDL